MAFCVNCGEKIEGTFTFCPKCGTRNVTAELADSQQNDQIPQNQVQTAAELPRRRKMPALRIWGIIGFVYYIICLFACGSLVINENNYGVSLLFLLLSIIHAVVCFKQGKKHYISAIKILSIFGIIWFSLSELVMLSSFDYDYLTSLRWTFLGFGYGMVFSITAFVISFNKDLLKDFTVTHNVSLLTNVEGLSLRHEPNPDIDPFTIIPDGTEIQHISTGKEVKFQNIMAPWFEILTKDGISGWCFSGSLKRIKKHNKFTLALVIIAVVIIAAIAVNTSEYDFMVVPNGNKLTITKYWGTESNVSIPQRIFLKQITSIGDSAFSGYTSLASVTIPDSVTSIGDSAFWGCKSLINVTIPNKVISIGDGAFGGCTSLAAINVDAGNNMYSSQDGVLYNKNKSILIMYPAGAGASFTILDNVTSIGERAFYNCTDIINVIIGNNVTSIGDYAFSGCERLISVTIGNSVTNIGDSAFSGCISLTSVIIPSSIINIGRRAFNSCTSLTSVTFLGTILSNRSTSDRSTSDNKFLSIIDEIDSIIFPGDLFDKFYATNKTYGTPGTYTRVKGSDTWTRRR